MGNLTNKQKKDWAQTLICKMDYTQKEAAVKIGVSPVTMNKWYKDGNWERLKQSLLVTRENQLSRIYMQMDELTGAIMKRPEGERFANSKEGDTLKKLAATIKDLETEASIADLYEAGKRFLNYVRSYVPQKAIEIAHIYDDFITDSLKQ